MMPEAILSASPPRRPASLVTAAWEARRNGLPSGSRTGSASERTDARGHRVTPGTPRDVERAHAADRR
jgi:hypothetical protein